MKIVINLNEEEQQFIRGLLSDTREQFAQAFRDLAKSESVKGKRKFASDWISLAELAFCKNIIVEDRTDGEEQKGGSV